MTTGLAAEKALKELDIGQLLDRIMNKFGDKIGMCFVIPWLTCTQHPL
jgi:hypothetical protein